ncbi:MAG: sensor histidine kinase [Salinivirgaceae bacterium]|nr:sensor histidine kinase [Salinivirgaceae bacterium]
MRLMKRNFIIIFAYVVFLLVASSFVFYFGYKNNYPNFKSMPVAEKGVLDLTSYDFSKHKLIKLSGQAEFYYNQLLTPQELNDSIPDNLSGYQDIYGVWNDFKINNLPIGAKGFATYRYKIMIPDSQLYGIKIKEFDCAYNIWINGFGPMSAGIVAAKKENYKPSWKRNEFYITARNNELDIVIQIANFSHRKGGPEDSIILGKGRDLLQYKTKRIAIEYILFGILAIMAIYHLVLFFYRPTDKSILYFSLLNVAMTFRLLTTGEKIFLDLFPSFSWIAAVRIEYISYTLAVPAFFYFIYSLYNDEINKIYVKIVGWIAISFTFFILIMPSTIFSYTPLIYQMVVVVGASYILYVLVIAMLKRRDHAFVIFGGYFLFFLIIMNDLLYYNKFLNTSFIMPLGLFIMVFSQAFVLSKKTSKAFTDVERLSSTLDKYNKELEDMVDERVMEVKKQSHEIEEQKEILFHQAEELKQIYNKLVDLDKFKENMTHMIVHDLKNPLNVVLNQTKDAVVRLAGNQMLNLVRNILDVQKYEETKMELNFERNSISLVIKNAIEQVRILLEKKNVTLENNINTSGRFNFDLAIIERVVVNLLSNAVSYVPDHGLIKLNYKLEGNDIYIEFFNSGPNVPEDEKDYIFSKYGHEKGHKSFFTASTGLGLTFSKFAIDAHKGSIGFYNHKNEGVTFCFSLPIGEHDTGSFDQNISFLRNSHIHEEVELDLLNVLTIADKDYLNTIREDLKGLEIYEITKYKAALKKINQSFSVGVYIWLESVQKALQAIDEERLKSLIKLLD